ncbi:MAG: cysteine desulfurase, partial [Clostridia bacterium]|nr:cysteine desulfurase [Clostridia bacterium]
MSECYLDNSATTKPCKKAVENMLYALETCWGNPSSLHDKGIEADELLLKARKAVALALSANEKEIYFTSGGTEGNNLAIFGAAYKNRRKGNRVITTAVEHPSVQKAFDRLQSEGFEVVRLKTDPFGRVSKEDLYEAIDEKTVLVSMMYVNNEVGAIEPVEEIRKAVKFKNSPALIHVDAVQAFGKLPINVRTLGADLVTISSHKIHGPKGVGAIYIRDGVKLQSVAVGGGQERDIRPGTEAMPAIAGFLGAVESLTVKESLQKLTKLRDEFTDKLRSVEGITVNSPDDALPYIVNLSLNKLNSETVLNFMSGMGIYVSSGSACSKGHKSPVLTAMGLSDEIINSSIRVSLSRYTTEEELDAFVEA